MRNCGLDVWLDRLGALFLLGLGGLIWSMFVYPSGGLFFGLIVGVPLCVYCGLLAIGKWQTYTAFAILSLPMWLCVEVLALIDEVNPDTLLAQVASRTFWLPLAAYGTYRAISKYRETHPRPAIGASEPKQLKASPS